MKHTDHDESNDALQKAVSALARGVEQLTREVRDLKGGMRQTASKQALAELANVVTNLSETVMKVSAGARKTDDAPVRSWLRLQEGDRAAVEEVLGELVPWMQTIYLRYHDGAETLPPCWLWHPEIVEELLWLMDAWTAAYYGPDASVRLVGDWHDRQRPGAMRRIGLYTDNCDLITHREHADQVAVTVPLAGVLDEFVTWWAESRDNTGPAPSDELIRSGRHGGLSAVPVADGGGY